MCPHNCFTNIFYTVLYTDCWATKGHKPERSNKFTFQTAYNTITYTKTLGWHSWTFSTKCQSGISGPFHKAMKWEFWSSFSTLLIVTRQPWKKIQWKTSKWKLRAIVHFYCEYCFGIANTTPVQHLSDQGYIPCLVRGKGKGLSSRSAEHLLYVLKISLSFLLPPYSFL